MIDRKLSVNVEKMKRNIKRVFSHIGFIIFYFLLLLLILSPVPQVPFLAI